MDSYSTRRTDTIQPKIPRLPLRNLWGLFRSPTITTRLAREDMRHTSCSTSSARRSFVT